MAQKKEEILEFYKNDVQSASKEVEGGELFSEYDEIRIIYLGHYPQYREDFDEIEKNVFSFFDFGEYIS